MKKQTLSAQHLRELILDTIADQPDLMSQVTDLHRADVVLAVDGAEAGANWTVRSATNQDQYRPAFARLLRGIQAQFDLED